MGKIESKDNDLYRIVFILPKEEDKKNIIKSYIRNIFHFNDQNSVSYSSIEEFFAIGPFVKEISLMIQKDFYLINEDCIENTRCFIDYIDEWDNVNKDMQLEAMRNRLTYLLMRGKTVKGNFPIEENNIITIPRTCYMV